MSRPVIRAALFAASLAVSGAVASAQEPRLPELSLEELLGVQIEPVFGASERLQPVTEAPASVTIITADDIRRYGYRTLADILRSVRGFVITSDRNYTYAGIRGFSQPGDFNTRLLLLVNGHRINDNVYDQAYIGEELNIDVAMFERVEIIRGPASALYGTSAFFAVINVITRSGGAIDGLWIDAGAGNLGTAVGRVSFGRAFAGGLELALSAKHQERGGDERLYFETFDSPATNHGIAEDLDAERASTAYGQVKWRGFALTATAGRRLKYIPTASYYTAFNSQAPKEKTSDARSMVHARWDGAVGATTFGVDLSFDHLAYEGVYPYVGADVGSEAPVAVSYDFATGNRWGAAARARRLLPGRQTVTVGTELIANTTQRQANHSDDATIARFLSDVSSSQVAVFVDDEIRVRPWLLLNGGLRHDRYEQFSETTPRGAVIVIPSPNQSFKYLYGQAFRAPNAYELHYYRATVAGLRPESIRTHELVWEQYVGEWLRTSLSAYRSFASALISLQLVDPDEGTLGFMNRGDVRSQGLEFEIEARTRTGLQAVASAALQRSVDDAGAPLVNWPRRVAEMRASAPGPWAGSTFSAEVHHVGARPTLLGTSVDAYTLFHGSFDTRFAKRFHLVGAMRNVFNTRFADPASAEHRQDAIEQYGRTFRVGIRWEVRIR